MLQIALKLLASVVIVGLALWAVKEVWTHQIDVRRTFNVSKRLKKAVEDRIPVALRDNEAIYQNGEEVARVSGAVKIEPEKQTILFEELIKAGKLDLGKPFEFRKYRLSMKSTESVIGLISGQVEKGTVISNCTCVITGQK
jgi:hypothetical protein